MINQPNRAKIIDPFLLALLEDRRNEKGIQNILRSIQAEQNDIIEDSAESGYDGSILVQGCAGSGKTMILLHRLSNIKYSTGFDGVLPYIIVPNEEFVEFIGGLSSSLDIADIKTITMSQMYSQIAGQLGIEIFMDRYIKYLHQSELTNKAVVTIDINAIRNVIKEIRHRQTEYASEIDGEINRLRQRARDFKEECNKSELVRDHKFMVEFSDIDAKRTSDREPDTGDRGYKYHSNVKDFLPDGIKEVAGKSDIAETDWYKDEYGLHGRAWGRYIKDTSLSTDEYLDKVKPGAIKNVKKRYNAYNRENDERDSLIKDRKKHLEDIRSFGVWLSEEFAKSVPAEFGNVDEKSQKTIFLLGYLEYMRIEDPDFKPSGAKESNQTDRAMLCIDEGQDYNLLEYELLQALYPDAIFNVYGDIEQNIGESGLASWNDLEDLLVAKRYDLDVNYRNSLEIVDYVNRVVDKNMRGMGLSTQDVEEIDLEDLVTYIYFESNDLDNRVLVISEDDRDILRYVDGDRIQVKSVMESKGLEYDTVFVMPSVNKLSSKFKYVALTRALSNLYIVRE